MSSFYDGLDRDDGYIEGAKPGPSGKRLYEALSFTYRPVSKPEWMRVQAEMESTTKPEDFNSVVEAEMVACKCVAEHLISWSLKKVGVHAVPVTPENVMNMNHVQFLRLWSIIRDFELSDPKPPVKEPPPSTAELLGNSPAASG